MKDFLEKTKTLRLYIAIAICFSAFAVDVVYRFQHWDIPVHEFEKMTAPWLLGAIAIATAIALDIYLEDK